MTNKEIPFLEIVRLEDSQLYGTFGMLLFQDKVFCATLELPYKDNQKKVSCIPEGYYFCSRTHSPKFGDVFQVMDVPNRDNILFHAGNTIADIEGCIIVAQYHGKLKGNRAALNSGLTYKMFMNALNGINGFDLMIRSCHR